MRVFVKFSGVLLLGTCGILAAHAVDGHRREVDFFKDDMQMDHVMAGELLAGMIRKDWNVEAAARHLPHEISHRDRSEPALTRRMLFATMFPKQEDDGWKQLPRHQQQLLLDHHVASDRDHDYQQTLVPILTEAGELAMVLSVREPFAEEVVFSNASLVRSVLVTLGVVILFAVFTLVSGFVWVDRPIRALVAGARRIGSGDLGSSIQVPGHGEFALLAGELDTMRRSLAAASAAVATATEHRIAALEQLRHADRLATVGRLAAGIAHELGTPLNVVGETAKMIGRGELAGAELAEGAHTIVVQTERMTAVIRQLLDFARPRAAIKAATDLGQLGRRTQQFLDSMAQRRGVELRVGDGAPAVAHVDAGQLEQVLTNLVVNAIQATPAGGRVELAAARVRATPPPERGGGPGTWCRLDVRDTGTGIEAEHMRRLFEPFFTTKGVGEGTGLGLSVSRGIVRENGGWIEVQSAPGRGSTFSVFLPPAEAADG